MWLLTSSSGDNECLLVLFFCIREHFTHTQYSWIWGGIRGHLSFMESPLILLFLTSRTYKKVRVFVPKPYHFLHEGHFSKWHKNIMTE